MKIMTSLQIRTISIWIKTVILLSIISLIWLCIPIVPKTTIPLSSPYKDERWNYSYVQIGNLPLYIFSAVAQLDRVTRTYPLVSVTVWDGTGSEIYKCCFILPNGDIRTVKAALRASTGTAPLTAKQYECTLDTNLPQKMTLVQGTETCILNGNYTDIYYPALKVGQFAICTKVSYGTLKPKRLVEWFEYQRLMGVDKIFNYVYNLDKESRKILENYERKGYAELKPYRLPGPLRGFDLKTRTYPQHTHDAQIAVYDCQERLQGYSYVAVIDFDEFIVLKKNTDFKDLMKNSLLKRWKSGAVFTLRVGFFITDWGKTVHKSSLYTLQYTNRSNIRYECYKNVYIPERVQHSSLTTHGIKPEIGYTRKIVPKNVAVLHHYRRCPTVVHWKNCHTIERYTDNSMFMHQSNLEKRVAKAWNEFRNSG